MINRDAGVLKLEQMQKQSQINIIRLKKQFLLDQIFSKDINYVRDYKMFSESNFSKKQFSPISLFPKFNNPRIRRKVFLSPSESVTLSQHNYLPTEPNIQLRKEIKKEFTKHRYLPSIPLNVKAYKFDRTKYKKFKGVMQFEAFKQIKRNLEGKETRNAIVTATTTNSQWKTHTITNSTNASVNKNCCDGYTQTFVSQNKKNKKFNLGL
jgi:hypothetical protein